MSFTARYDDECAVCDGAIYEGDEITLVEGEAVHDQCAERPYEIKR